MILMKMSQGRSDFLGVARSSIHELGLTKAAFSLTTSQFFVDPM